MSDELKPCPFCGSKDVSVSTPLSSFDTCVICFNCDVTGPEFDGSTDGAGVNDERAHDYAVDAWNTRPIEQVSEGKLNDGALAAARAEAENMDLYNYPIDSGQEMIEVYLKALTPQTTPVSDINETDIPVSKGLPPLRSEKPVEVEFGKTAREIEQERLDRKAGVKSLAGYYPPKGDEIEPVAWTWYSPKGGSTTADKPSNEYQSSPLYSQATVTALQAEVERLKDLADQLKQQAIQHAGEARGANASLHKCYQAVSGSTGEKANWNGPKPVEEYVERMEANLSTIRAKTVEAVRSVIHKRVIKLQMSSNPTFLAVETELNDIENAIIRSLIKDKE